MQAIAGQVATANRRSHGYPDLTGTPLWITWGRTATAQ